MAQLALKRCRIRRGAPPDGLDGADEEEPGGGAGEGDGGEDHGGPVELAGALKDEAGHRWGEDAGEIADEILEAGPASRRDRARERLGDSPKVGGDDAEKDEAEDESG